jgi:hypothetical protein
MNFDVDLLSVETLSIFAVSSTELSDSNFSFLKSAAEEENTDTVLDSVLCISAGLLELRTELGETEDGTRTTENIR